MNFLDNFSIHKITFILIEIQRKNNKRQKHLCIQNFSECCVGEGEDSLHLSKYKRLLSSKGYHLGQIIVEQEN